MPIRIRKLVGAIALIVLVLVWTLTAMAIAQFPLVKANGFVETIYYVLAGLGSAGHAAHSLDDAR